MSPTTLIVVHALCAKHSHLVDESAALRRVFNEGGVPGSGGPAAEAVVPGGLHRVPALGLHCGGCGARTGRPQRQRLLLGLRAAARRRTWLRAPPLA